MASDEETSEFLARWVSVGSKVLAGCFGVAVSSVTKEPFAGAVASPFVAHELERAGKEIISGRLGSRQEERVGATIVLTSEAIQRRLQRGEQLRNDGFFDANSGRSAADELTEAMLIAAMQAHEERKLPFMASLLAGLCFDPSIDRSTANLYISLSQRLRFREYVLMHIIKSKPFGKYDATKYTDTNIESSLRSEAFEMLQMGLLRRFDDPSRSRAESDVLSVVGIEFDKMYLRNLGNAISSLLDLDSLDQDDEYYSTVLNVCNFSIENPDLKRIL